MILAILEMITHLYWYRGKAGDFEAIVKKVLYNPLGHLYYGLW
jgi:hypothetical protein